MSISTQPQQVKKVVLARFLLSVVFLIWYRGGLVYMGIAFSDLALYDIFENMELV